MKGEDFATTARAQERAATAIASMERRAKEREEKAHATEVEAAEVKAKAARKVADAEEARRRTSAGRPTATTRSGTWRLHRSTMRRSPP